jgi:hypothetical protein
MRKGQDNLWESLRAVQGFLESNADKTGQAVNANVRRRLAEAIATLETHAAEQGRCTHGARVATWKFHKQRETLLQDHMTLISRVARLILPDTPDGDAFRMPPANASVERLTTAAQDMAKAAAPLADQLVDAGLRPEFLAQLTAAADAMVQPLAQRAELRDRLKEATKGIKASLASARDVVGIIDALLEGAFASDPGFLAGWRSVKRVRKVRARRARRPSLVLI